MFCNQCGKEVNEGSNFCKSCGSHIENQTETIQLEPEPLKKNQSIFPSSFTPMKKVVISTFVILLIIILLRIFLPSSTGQVTDQTTNSPVSTEQTVSDDTQTINVQPVIPVDPLQVLSDTPQSDIKPDGELYNIYKYGSNYTDVQRENKINEIKGKIVQWSLPVYEVRREENIYIVTTSERSGFLFSGNYVVSTKIHLSPRSSQEREYIESLKTNDMITIKGKIKGISFPRMIEIEPTIVVSNENKIITTDPEQENKQIERQIESKKGVFFPTNN